MIQQQLEGHRSPEPIDREEFYTGLLLNLQEDERAKGIWMNHEAMRVPMAEALRAVRDDVHGAEIEGIDWDVIDDPHRQSRFVKELIAFGQSSRLLSLQNVDLEKGGTKERTGDGRKRLFEAIGRTELFERVGRAFIGKMT